jgi:hypothetical protein
MVATLAICLAANVAIFAVVDRVILRPLPFPEPHRLVAIYNTYPGVGVDIAPSSAMDFYDRQRLSALAGLATYQRAGLTVGDGRSESERVTGLAPGEKVLPARQRRRTANVAATGDRTHLRATA